MSEWFNTLSFLIMRIYYVNSTNANINYYESLWADILQDWFMLAPLCKLGVLVQCVSLLY